jgi:hypothetical protein
VRAERGSEGAGGCRRPEGPKRSGPTDWGELVQIDDDRDVFQASPDELPVIDIHSL